MRKAFALVLLLITSSAATVVAAPAVSQSTTCPAASPGRYVVMGQGIANGKPIARLLLEDWSADGRISGHRFNRDGLHFFEQSYSGNYRNLQNCLVEVTRQNGDRQSRTHDVLDRQGKPRFALSVTPGTILSKRYWSQSVEKCQASDLDGVILSQQTGLSWINNKWQPNAVVQREEWQAGLVEGLAIMSTNGTIEQVSYKGSIKVEPSCLARVEEKDGKGVKYNYRAIVLSGGRGYIYLQSDAEDFTLGLLEKQ